MAAATLLGALKSFLGKKAISKVATTKLGAKAGLIASSSGVGVKKGSAASGISKVAGLLSGGSSSGSQTNVSSGAEISPTLERLMEPIDRGFFGHMNAGKIKRAKIQGGINGAK